MSENITKLEENGKKPMSEYFGSTICDWDIQETRGDSQVSENENINCTCIGEWDLVKFGYHLALCDMTGN